MDMPSNCKCHDVVKDELQIHLRMDCANSSSLISDG